MADSEQKPYIVPQSNKEPAVKAQVIARKLTGESNSSIGRDLGISRQTVAVILAEAELGNYIQDAKENFLNAIPIAAYNLIESVKAGSVASSITLLKGIGVLNDKLIIEESAPVETGEIPSYFASASPDTRTTHQPN